MGRELSEKCTLFLASQNAVWGVWNFYVLAQGLTPKSKQGANLAAKGGAKKQHFLKWAYMRLGLAIFSRSTNEPKNALK